MSAHLGALGDDCITTTVDEPGGLGDGRRGGEDSRSEPLTRASSASFHPATEVEADHLRLKVLDELAPRRVERRQIDVGRRHVCVSTLNSA